MSLPSGVTTATLVVGAAGDFFGNTGTVKLDVTPVLGGNAQEIVWSATGDAFISDTATATSTVGGTASIAVPHVNQAGWVDSNNTATTMWSYRCVITATVGANVKTWTKNVQPLSSQVTIDLDLVPDGDITPPTSAPFPPVISVNGQTGVVVISGTGGASAVTSVAGRTGDVILTKSDVGLSAVNNTSDAAKPVSTATQTALNLKATDAQVVHLSGAESVSGVKTFASPPVVPTPVGTTDAVNKAYADALGGGASAPDASPTVKGIVQLTGALGGTATAPTTPTAVHVSGAESISGVKTFAASPIVPTPTAAQTTAAASVAFVLAGNTPDATTTTKGVVQLANHLAGTAAAPTVPGLALKLAIASNLSDLASAATARTNLGLGTIATQAATAFADKATLYDVSGLIFDPLIPDFAAAKIVSGTIGIAFTTPGSTITVFRTSGGTGAWPARPSRRADITVQWVGLAPAPAIDATYAIAGSDLWQEDAS